MEVNWELERERDCTTKASKKMEMSQTNLQRVNAEN